MTTAIENDHFLKELKLWCVGKELVLAALLTSTRAVPGLTVDGLSDYDIILVVDEVKKFHEDRRWIEHFGKVLVTYWDPLMLGPEVQGEYFGNVIQYSDGLKVDFTLWNKETLIQMRESNRLVPELDAGYLLLLDKAGLAAGLKAPTHTAYLPAKPTEVDFQKSVEDFFSDVPYVAKCICRDELFPLKWALDYDMKLVYLKTMLEWRRGVETNWSVPVAALGKGLTKTLTAEEQKLFCLGFAAAGMSENWEALFETIAFYRQIAKQVASSLGFSYPKELDESVVEYTIKLKARFGAGKQE